MRERVTVEEVAADPTNCFQVTVHGDAAIKELTIHDDSWVYIKYENGGSSAGTSKHWHSFVRVTDDATTTIGTAMITVHAHPGETLHDVSHRFVRDIDNTRAACADPSADGETVTLYATDSTIEEASTSIVTYLSAEAAEQLAAQLLCSARLVRQARS